MTRDSSPSKGFQVEPIGRVSSPLIHRQDAPRQGTAEGGSEAVIVLHDPALREGLRGLAGFERLWIIFLFHKNSDWHLLTRPPRSEGKKVGVFASRSPYRPNGIGMSAVRLIDIDEETLRIRIGDSDILDGTPVLDIKPYLPYSDAFPGARTGWVDDPERKTAAVRFTAEAMRRIVWVREEGGPDLAAFARRELSWMPEDNTRKRLYTDRMTGNPSLAYRTWRLPYILKEDTATVFSVKSSYSDRELESCADPFHDQELHSDFINHFQDARDPREC